MKLVFPVEAPRPWQTPLPPLHHHHHHHHNTWKDPYANSTRFDRIHVPTWTFASADSRIDCYFARARFFLNATFCKCRSILKFIVFLREFVFSSRIFVCLVFDWLLRLFSFQCSLLECGKSFFCVSAWVFLWFLDCVHLRMHGACLITLVHSALKLQTLSSWN